MQRMGRSMYARKATVMEVKIMIFLFNLLKKQYENCCELRNGAPQAAARQERCESEVILCANSSDCLPKQQSSGRVYLSIAAHAALRSAESASRARLRTRASAIRLAWAF